MKSVLFVSYSMGIGGVEKALLGVCNKFTKEGWDVHLALMRPEGEFLKYLPEGVSVRKVIGFEQIQPLIHTPMKETVLNDIRRRSIIRAFIIGVCLLCSKVHHGAKRLYDYAFKKVPAFSDEVFDLAVAFAGPDAFIDTYVDKRINAKEKWGWIHFDISKFGYDHSIIAKVYKKYSVINIVSEQAKSIFDRAFPQFIDKTHITPNIIDKELTIRLSYEKVEIPDSRNRIVILTVGRISSEKGQYKALQALKSIVDSGEKNIEWWFVGDGSDRLRCEEYVLNEGLSDFVWFAGAKANPYPYMKKCDIYVQPSEHEGFCITLAEAKLFGMPIIATDFTGAGEQLMSYPYMNAIVNNNSESIACTIKKMIINAR